LIRHIHPSLKFNSNSLLSYHPAGGNYREGKDFIYYAFPYGMRFWSFPDFVGFADVLKIRLLDLLLAVSLSLEKTKWYRFFMYGHIRLKLSLSKKR